MDRVSWRVSFGGGLLEEVPLVWSRVGGPWWSSPEAGLLEGVPLMKLPGLVACRGRLE
jgi:hypothetical protein